ncbi:hypothetical protein ABZV31_26365 [Streptomyces sp. NPDC005202]|uniref:hypothetical protein n=1 Tax=Streptomyces sp. NPDC005202 TaxID=3157021 RepID=UPI0033AF24FE
MTIRSSPPQSNQSVIAFTKEIHSAEPPSEVVGGGEAERSDGDPVRGLVQAAVSARPLEEIVRLVTLLEESPEYADAVVHVLRAVAVDRPVEDVARLVAELTRPPRPADSADDTIRAAVGSRCPEDVTRLMVLLHRAPLQPHCGREAARAAATGRPVEELVELIGRLAREARERHDRPYGAGCELITIVDGAAIGSVAGLTFGSGALPPPPVDEPHERGSEPSGGSPGDDRPGRTVFWPSWLAAAALVVCGTAYFPVRREGTSPGAYGVTLAVSGLCVALALVLALRATVAVLVWGAVLPAALAAAGWWESRFPSAALARALNITVAPPWSAGTTAVCASLASLAALLLLLMVQLAERHPPPRPTD